MQIMNNVSRVLVRLTPLVLLAAAAASCGIEKQSAPELIGPSEFGKSVTLSATPDVVSRDGVSQATINVTARDGSNQPLRNLVLNLSMSPSFAGSLSATQVTTDAEGRASFLFTAPDVNTPVRSVTIGATPRETNFDNASTRTVVVALNGPEAPSPSFTVNPSDPMQFESVTLDASSTTLEGLQCGSVCTYDWDMGNGYTTSGQVISYRFPLAQTYMVTLTVTTPAGMTARIMRVVVVAAGEPPEAVISPDGEITIAPGQMAMFSGAESTAPAGATIVEYSWDLGDGVVRTGVSAGRVFATEGSYTVTLTVRDSNGMTDVATAVVKVEVPDAGN